MMKYIRAVFVMTLFTVLSACGGGGGSAGNTSGVALYTNSAEKITVLPGAAQTYNIGGGIPSYSATSSSGATSVSVNGKTLTITGSGVGKSTVTVTDSAGAKVLIDVTVGTGFDFFVNAPEKITLSLGAVSSTFDFGGGSGIYTVTSSNPGIARVTTNGTQFFVVGVAAGSATISAADNAGGKKSIEVTVGAGVGLFTNAPASLVVAIGVSTQSFTIGGGTQVYTVSSSDSQVATVKQTGDTFVVSGVSTGTSTVTITDSAGASKAVAVTVGLTQPLFTTAPESLTVGVGASTQSFKVGGGALAYVVISSNQQIATVRQTGSDFVITGVAPGVTTIVITDAVGASKQISVTVGSNQALFSTAPTILEVGIGSTSSVFEIGGGEPAYVVTSSNSSVASVSNSANKFTVNGVSSGKAVITISDRFGQKISLSVNVSSGSDLFTTAPESLTVGVGASTQSFAIGGGTLVYTVASSNWDVVNVNKSGSTFVISGVSPGTGNVTITDSSGARKIVLVTVGSTQPLFTTAPETLTVGVGASTQSFKVGGGALAYTVISSNQQIATVRQTGSDFVITGVAPGATTIVITDVVGASKQISLTVGSNQALFSTAPTTLDVGIGSTSSVFEIGGGEPAYVVTSSNSSVASVSSNTNKFTVNGVSSGKAVITISDKFGQKISLTVNVSSGSDLFTTAPESLTVGVGASTQSFTIGGGTQVYTVASSNLDIVNVNKSGNTFVISGVTPGTSNVTITDSSGARKVVSVTVGSTQPLYMTAPESLTVGVGASTQSFRVGGGAQAYTVISSNQQIATVRQTGSDFVITGVAPGATTILITDVVGASKRISLTVGSNQALFSTAPTTVDVGIGSTSSVFEIGGGEPAYVVTSSNNSVASVSSSTNKFTVNGVSSGRAVITISDKFGQKISLNVNVSSGSDLFTTAPESLTVGVGASTQSFAIGGGTQVYTVASSNLDIVNVNKSGNTFVISGVTPGTSNVTITDSSGARKVVSVTVGASQPLFTTAPENLTIGAGVSTQSFRAGGGAQAYTVISSNQQIATVSQIGSEFVITGVAPGSTTIVITDVVGATKRINLTVGSNQALFITAPASLDVGIGSTSATFDIGGGDPAYVVTTSNSLVATVSNSLNKFTVTGVSSGKAIITVSDKFGQKVSLNVNVSSGSDLYITAPVTVSVGLGLTSSTYTIGGGSKVYTVSSGNNSIVSVAQNGNQFVLKGESLGTVKVTVSDSLGAARTIDVSVVNGLQLYTTAPNALTVGVGVNSSTYLIGGGAAPYSVASSNSAVVTVFYIGTQFYLTGGISGKATVLITDGVGGSKSIDVTVSTGSDLFTNAGTEINVGVGVTTSPFVVGGGSLVYSVSTANAQIATISIQSNTFTVTGVAVGKTSLFVTDSLGATKKIDVTVGSPLDLFVTSPLDLTIGVGVTSPQYNIGGGTSPYAVASSNTQVFSVTLTGSSFTISGVSAGKGNLIVTDARGATKSISVTVGSGIDLYTTAPTSVIVAVNASSQIYKIGGGSEVYSVSSSNDQIVVVGQNTNREFVITGRSGGKAVVSVKDSAGKEVKIDVIVGTVDAMFSTAASNINLDVGGANTFKVGGGTGVYSVGSSNTSVAQATISGNDLLITGVGVGNATIVVRDTTTGSITINVAVGASTPIALFTTAPSDIIVAPGTNPTFVIGGGKAPYAVTSSNPGVLTASVNGTTLTLGGVVAGNSRINVTDSVGVAVVINAVVGTGNSIALFTTAPATLVLASGSSGTYTIGGGAAPYTVTTSNPVVAAVVLNGSSFTINGLIAGNAIIVVKDSLGISSTINLTVSSTAFLALGVLPGDSTGAVGDTLNFTISGGSSPFVVTNSNPSIATVVQTGSTFTAKLINVGSTIVTVVDSQGVNKQVVVTATANNSLLRISPSTLEIGEDYDKNFTLEVKGGTPPYRVFTSDLVKSSVSIVNSIITVGLGTQNSRCIHPVDLSGVYQFGTTMLVNITVLDQLGSVATSTMAIRDNNRGIGPTNSCGN